MDTLALFTRVAIWWFGYAVQLLPVLHTSWCPSPVRGLRGIVPASSLSFRSDKALTADMATLHLMGSGRSFLPALALHHEELVQIVEGTPTMLVDLPHSYAERLQSYARECEADTAAESKRSLVLKWQRAAGGGHRVDRQHPR